MTSNSSAAAVAAMFGISDTDHQEQMKPLLAQQLQHQLPPAPLLNAAASSSAGSGQATGASPPPVKKKRNLPDPDAEVIALSPKTLLATNRFVCEVCNKGFQREQNLQLHRRGHNLPWKLKQKNPAQAQRRRVYLCPEPTCVLHDPARAHGDLMGLKKHFCRKHGEKKWKCDKCSKRYAVQSDWKAHSKICGTREYRCDCGTLFSRRDSFITHRAFCDARSEESAKFQALQDIHLVGGGVGLPERALPYKSPSLCLASDLKQFSSPEADELKQVSLRGDTAHNYWLEHGLMNAEVHDSKQFTPSPHMSASSLVQKALQMGATSSSSSSLINKQETIGRVKKHKYEEMKIGVDSEHGGIVGRADEKHDIMKLIMSHGQRFTIICITGGHGLGKTALASLVYWDDTMCRSFEARAWMCLSHVTDIEELLRSTVSSLTGVLCRLNDRYELEELVKEELMGKKFLLVLDDLHESNVEICRRLIPLLSVGDKGSAVMVTTSTNLVVGSLGTAHAYNLKPFMPDVFLNMATPHSVQYPSLKSIICRMPSEYFGFPTFAKAIHGIIYSVFTLLEHLVLDECLGLTLEAILTDILNKPDNLLDNLLCLSYSYLSPYQQRCLAYCSMFPKDYTYNKEKLLRLWMSQGLIIPDREKDRDGDREDAFDELLHRSFFDHC